AVQIKLGLLDKLPLGNLDALRDWGFAGDYVTAMWLMLQQDTPDDFVIGSGKTNSVRNFCELAFSYLDLDYKDYVVVDETFYRPKESNPLVADISQARNRLGWQPEVSLEQLVHMMVDADLNSLKNRD
ncbi:MAG: GDP-mannose 4,6-dehydratase, partial [Anaerolineaceae bacterium]|nr:GDP-mannose 4,6-dehydratase [Anaerolineaceae bacterium]